jgi:bisphosphoglycerate-independent phosphoglycerate mutase (AlkP superfamily)
VIVDGKGVPVGTIEDGDAVVLFNFRADRMVEISKAFEYPDFDIFDRERYPKVGVGTVMALGMQQSVSKAWCVQANLWLPANMKVCRTSGLPVGWDEGL